VTGTTWQRCTRCRRKVNGAAARQRHRASDCTGTSSTWAAKVDLPRDADGRRRQLVRAGFATEAEANRERRALLTKVDGGRYVEQTHATLADYLAGEWLPATAPPKVAHSTHDKRRLHVRWVVDEIGRTPLHDVNGATLDRLYATLVRDGGRDQQGLAAATVQDVHRTLHKAFTDAVRWRLLERNPCEAAEPPRADRVAEDARAKQHAWTADELRTFLTATAGHRLHLAFHLAAATGMRRSELLGLRWSDLDLDRGTLRVAQKLVKAADGYVLHLSTKTAAGARTIALDDGTVSRLRDHRLRQVEQRLAAGSAWHHLDLVLTREDGSPIPPEAVSQGFRRAVATAGVPRIRFHDVRHSHASLLLAAGEPVKVVSERLGHASPTITLTIYAHVMPGQQQGAAATFGRLLAGEVV
jgi:integrase